MTTNMTTKFVSAFLAVTATMVSFAEVTRAETLDFAYSPVELATSQGAAELDERIRKFARNNCRFQGLLNTPQTRRDCREDIEAQLRDAVTQGVD